MKITVKELKEMLNAYPEDCVMYFSGLEFNRLKQSGGKLLQVVFEHNQFPDIEAE
jgi:hypothetical protein